MLLAFYTVPFSLVLYAGSFGLALAMPGWRSLGALTLAGAGFWVLLLTDPLDSPGAVFGYGAGLFVGFGLAGGLATRAATLFRGDTRRPLRSMAAAAVGFLAFPLAMEGVTQWDRWVRRPPSQACLASEFDIEIAKARLRVPAAPLFQVVTDRVGASNYYFHIGPSLRHFSELTGGAGAALRATALVMRFEHVDNSFNRWIAASCEPPHVERDALLCRRPGNGEPRRLVEVALYAPREYDHERRLGSRRGSYAAFVKETAGAPEPAPEEHVGAFERRTDRLWIARSPDWVTASGEPLILDCGTISAPKNWLYCSSTYDLGDGLRTTLEFRTPRGELETTARQVVEWLDRLLVALSD
jgi:hypothetical protein